MGTTIFRCTFFIEWYSILDYNFFISKNALINCQYFWRFTRRKWKETKRRSNCSNLLLTSFVSLTGDGTDHCNERLFQVSTFQRLQKVWSSEESQRDFQCARFKQRRGNNGGRICDWVQEWLLLHEGYWRDVSRLPLEFKDFMKKLFSKFIQFIIQRTWSQMI